MPERTFNCNIPTHRMSFLLLSLLCISACSSGGSGEYSKGSNDSNQLKEITINGLDYGFSNEFYEGETVAVSLNAQGDGASNLSYDRSVEDGIDFRGQNTDTKLGFFLSARALSPTRALAI